MVDHILGAIVTLTIVVVTTAYYSYRNLTKLPEEPAPTKQAQTRLSQEEVSFNKPPAKTNIKPSNRRKSSNKKNKTSNKKSSSSTASFENLNDIAMNRVISSTEDELKKKNQVPSLNTQTYPSHVIKKYAAEPSSTSTKRFDKNDTTKINLNLHEKGCAITCRPNVVDQMRDNPASAHNSSNNVRNNEAVIDAPRSSPNLSIKSSSIPLCRFFLKGYCRNGLDCPFVHDTASMNRKSKSGDATGKRPTTNNLSAASSSASSPKLRSSFLVDDGILCDFGAGLVIQKLTLGTLINDDDDDDCSAIAISGLPVNRKILTRCDVERKLSCYGELSFLSVNQEKTYIVAGYDSPSMATAAMKSLNGSTVQSWILGASSSSTSSTRKDKDGQQSRTGGRIVPGKVSVVPLRSNAAATTSSSFAVKVTWYAPSRFAWVHFRHYRQAEFAVKRCHGQVFCGRTLTASVQAPSRLQWNNFTVWIGNLGEHVNRVQLQRFIEKRVKCDVQSIDLGDPCFTDKSAPSIVRQLIETHGAPLVGFEASTPNTMYSKSSPGTLVDLKRRALVRFASEEDAERTCEYFRLQGKIEELGGGKLFLQRLFSIKYRIPTRIFEAVESGIVAALNTNSAVRYSVFENRTSRSVLIYADAMDSIQQIKATMCSIIEGEIVRVPTQGNRILWNRYMASAEFRNKSLKLAASVPGSYVWVNERRQEVRVFGSNDRRRGELCQMVVNHCLGNTPMRLIPISRKLFDFIIQSHQHVLYNATRASRARFVSIDMRLKSLVVKGSEVAAARAKAYLMKLASFGEDGNLDPDVLCPVCFCPPGESGDLERCVRLSCGHSYCRDCFDAWLSMPQFPLTCLSEHCAVPVTIFDLNMNLDGDDLLCLLRNAIDDHVRKNPQSLQFCVSPTCGGIYQVPTNTDGKDTAPPTTTASCSSCSLDICIKCRAAHGKSMTCKDYHLTRLPPDKLRMKIIDDILTLRCPRCHQAFLDFEGCFALSCSVCPCHFCAWCLADCGQNAHPHVKICPRKDAHAKSCAGDSYFGTLEQFEAAQKRNRRDRLAEFLKNFPQDQQQSTMQSLQQELSDLGIQIDG